MTEFVHRARLTPLFHARLLVAPFDLLLALNTSILELPPLYCTACG